MFINTRVAIATIIKDLQKIGFGCFLIVQLLYIAFLSTSLFLNFGILIINIIGNKKISPINDIKISTILLLKKYIYLFFFLLLRFICVTP